MLSAFQRAKAVSLSPCFAECIRLAKKMNLVRREMQPTLNYYFILLCNDSTKDLAAEYIVNTLSKNKLSILISICLIKKKKKGGFTARSQKNHHQSCITRKMPTNWECTEE